MEQRDPFVELRHIMKPPLFFCAGEPSGDLYGALFAEGLQRSGSCYPMYGIGGPRMLRAGIAVSRQYHDMQKFGFGSALTSIPSSVRTYRDITALMRMIRPGTFIPIAYPGLNLPLCRYARRLGALTCYVLPPQVWAWGTFRKYFVRRWVDKVISVFPFEHRWYQGSGIDAILVDNPLTRMLQKYRRTETDPCIGFMPGSRVRCARMQIPLMSRAIARIQDEYPGIRCAFIVPEQPGLLASVHRAAGILNCRTPQERVFVQTENRYQAMKNCDLLITASGTASLEAFLMHIPQIFVHRPSFFDSAVMKGLLHVTEYNLVNLVHGRKQVPTCICRDREAILRFIGEHVHSAFSD